MNDGKLEIVLKCDVSGTEEAVRGSLASIDVPAIEVRVIQSGVGQISQSDVLMAETGSRLVVGFNVDVVPRLEQYIKEHGVEIRLYDTIYHLTEDIRQISEQLSAKPPEEVITGQAEVIATFKSKRKSQIIGCEIREGVIEVGNQFRIITAMGPAYSGRVGSLFVFARVSSHHHDNSCEHGRPEVPPSSWASRSASNWTTGARRRWEIWWNVSILSSPPAAPGNPAAASFANIRKRCCPLAG